ncbi:MAG: molybdenum cofactor guanylyltransferase [Saprospiraceae bacterium]|jgi:molybdopterin-guanine dinucleotide biosynthesis protein A|nr:molybdenum cofactor guanylyltransferase [Saprospiraceae bacterium]
MTGVVMMGGRSTRMGSDKSMLHWAGQPLYQHFFALLKDMCDSVLLSVNHSQHLPENSPFIVVTDLFENQGPAGGLISCYRSTNDDLLVVAVDTPLVGEAELEALFRLHTRNAGCTVFYNTEAEKYEPMPAIWEKEMLEELNVAYQQGERSLQVFLTEKSVTKHPCPFPQKLVSANTPGLWQEMIHHQTEQT